MPHQRSPWLLRPPPAFNSRVGSLGAVGFPLLHSPPGGLVLSVGQSAVPLVKQAH